MSVHDGFKDLSLRKFWQREYNCQDSLLKKNAARFWGRIVTTDERWFHYYDSETKQQSSQWKNTISPKEASYKHSRKEHVHSFSEL